jgi:DNA-binding protein H-NS
MKPWEFLEEYYEKKKLEAQLPQQETLYTEEQVREAMVKARLFKSSENADIIIQSLKQPKKD